MNDLPKLSPRLCLAASLIREGAFVADVGTDHAYLPIFLCLTGKARGAIATDVNEGPVIRARENVHRYKLEKKITVLRADGLCATEDFSPDDVMILGMGGELIARILSDAPWTKKGGLRLCLQPMTHPEVLRKFLLEGGYSILADAYAEEEKIYQIILAEYGGERKEYTPAELLVGKRPEDSDGIYERLCKKEAGILERRAVGKESAGENAETERKLIKELLELTGETL